MAERDRELADERANSRLSQAGCIDFDLGRAALERYGGDVAKLKEAKPGSSVSAIWAFMI